MGSEKNTTASVEELYLIEKKKASILMASTIVLTALLIGSVATRPDTSSTASGASQNTQDNIGQRGAGGRGGQAITVFFDEDGSVNQEAVDALASRFSQADGLAGPGIDRFLERFTLQIESSIESGEITQEQGDQLKAAFVQVESSEI